MKTLSLRIRGVKTELADAGLETEGMAETTAQLQAKLLALTGGKVDIMLNADEFKSTTQILREMASAWEDMTDVQQAAALELLGGKRQANILSSLLTNFQTVEDVIATSMNSAGSAMEENEKYLDSIQGRIDIFNNSLQTFWNNVISSDVTKWVVDRGTDIINILDTGTGKVLALVSALNLIAKFKGINISGVFQGLQKSIEQINSAKTALNALTLKDTAGGVFNPSDITAYASAVSVLTPKMQAQALAAEGLNELQIKQALSANQVSEENMKLAIAQVHATKSTQQYATVTGQVAQAILETQGITLSSTAADFLKEHSTEQVTEAMIDKMIANKALDASEKSNIMTALGLTGANHGLAASFKAVGAAISFAFKSNPLGFILSLATTILAAIPIVKGLADTFTDSSEEIKEQAQEISNTYSKAVDEINSNLEKLKIDDDGSIAALTKEFETLTAGVDRYGNNLSLTSDQYGRYKEICEQIVDINPRIASGYDSATEAIGNNADALSQLIEFQKERARLAAEEYVNDENLETLAKDEVNDYKDAQKQRGEVVGKRDELFGILSQGTAENTMKYILEKLGYGESEILNEIARYNMGDNNYDTYTFMKDFVEEINKEYKNFDGHVDELDKFFDEYENTIRNGEKSVEEAQNGLIDKLLIVPKSSKDYDKLTSEGKNFLADWINNNEIFKMDASTTAEDVQGMRDTILDMMDVLVDEAKTIDYNGKMVSAQDILEQIYNLDPSSVNYEDYNVQINTMLEAFWNSLSQEQKDQYGLTDFESFKITFGFDFETEKNQIETAKNQVAGFLDVSTDEIQKNLDGMTATEVKAFYSIDWNEVGKDGVGSWQDVINKINSTIGNDSIVVKTYSVLTESVEGYKEILTQTSEIITDNTKVSQEYKDSLAGLGISQEELNECFDDANPLVVKNAKALNKLVKEANKNVAANVKLAKSQSRLEYYDLVKQLNNTLNGTKKLNDATRSSIYSTLEQIDAVEKSLYQYQLLEDTLLGVNNAFDEFAEAQEIDSLNTYGDSYVEMAQTMYDALYKTGQVGTEAFWSSVEALVPTEVYQHLTDDADRMKAIYDYYNKSILPSLRLDEDELSLDYDAIEEFVKDGLKAGVFAGDKKDFDLVEGMNLERAAELMGMTETQAYALFAELDKYNTAGNEHSFLSQLDDSLEGRITNITNDLEDLNKQKLALLEDDGYEKNKEAIDEINSKLAKSEAELNKLGQEAYNTWQEYTKNDAVIAALSEVEDKTAFLTEEGANSLGLEWDEVKGQTVQQALDVLLAKQLELGEPTVLTAQLAIDNIDSQIDALKQKLKDSEEDPTVLGVKADADQTTIDAAKQKIESQIQALEEDMVVISTTFGIELSEEQKATVQEELNAVEQFTIHNKEFSVIVNGVSETNQALNSVKDTIDKIKDKSINLTTYDTTYKRTKKQKWDPRFQTWVAEANGTAHALGTVYKDGSWGAPRTETALVGELGPEMLVRNGRWTTVGDNGAEFTQVKKGDIIFNHKQTEDLLSKGYITGRGKLKGGSSAFASGTAYSGLWKPTSPGKEQSNKPGNDFSDKGNRLFDAADSLSSAAGDISSSADEFREVFDWIEVRLEEINEDLDFKNAKLENAVGRSAQNKIVTDMIKLNEQLYDNLKAGYDKYNSYAKQLLSKIPSVYREAAQNGSIAIETFVGEVNEKTLEAIQDYREWAQKAADAAKQAQEVITEISSLAKQAIDNISQDFENKTSLNDNKIDQLEAYNALLETDKGFESEKVYKEIIKANNANIEQLKKQRKEMQDELNAQVKAGNIKKYSQDWYDAVNEIAAVDTEIIELTTDTENYQDAINELHWDKFDALVGRLEAVSEEAENLIDILGNKDLVDDSGNWTDEGITTLGLYAQQMEAAEVQAKKYEEEIKYLNDNWQALGYTEEEYIEKLNELKDGQYDAIKAYHDSKDAIVDLNKERIDAIKEGIEKEIEAYEKLIDAKKEELDAEKDLYDFQKSIMEQQKDVADLERQLAALSGDNSASARAKRAQLEAELAEAKAALEESYYERSVQNQQEALDKELESFKEAKDKEMEGWDEYLENTEQVVSDSLATIQDNTDTVYQTLAAMGKEYSLSITDAITSPWKDGEMAIQSFSEQFGIAMSSTVEELEEIAAQFKATMSEIEQTGKDAVNTAKGNASGYTSAEEQKKESSNSGASSSGTPSTAGLVSSISGTISYGQTGDRVKKLQQALNELGYGNSGTSGLDGKFGPKTLSAVKAFQKAMGIAVDGKVGPETKKKFKLKGYAVGSTGVDKDQWALIDELGDELIMHADGNGRLAFLSKGSAVVPHNISENLMELGQLDPQNILDQNRPQIGVHPEIHNTEINLNITYGDMVSIGEYNGANIGDLEKMVAKQFDKHTKDINNALRKFTR